MRRIAYVLLVVLTLAVGAAAAAVIASQTPFFRNQLRGYIVEQAGRYVNGHVSVGALSGNLFFGVDLENVSISMNGRRVVSIEEIGAEYNLFQVVTRGVSIDELHLDQPAFYIHRDNGTWSLSRLLKRREQEAGRRGPAFPIAIDTITIRDGSIRIKDPVQLDGFVVPRQIDNLDARLSFEYAPVHYSVEIGDLSFRTAAPAVQLVSLSGGVSVDDDTVRLDDIRVNTTQTSLSVDGTIDDYLTQPTLALDAASDRVSLEELSAVIPALKGLPFAPSFSISLNGPLSSLDVNGRVESTAGRIDAAVTVDTLEPRQAMRGRVSFENVNLEPFVTRLSQPTHLTGRAQVDLQAESLSDLTSLNGTVSLESQRLVAAGYEIEKVRAQVQVDGRRIQLDGRATAYGIGATAKGRIGLSTETRPFTYDLSGALRGIDLQRLPASIDVPRADTNVTLSYHAVGSEPSGRHGQRSLMADLRFDESVVAGARIAKGSTASVDVQGERIQYMGDAVVTGANLERLGRAFSVPALATDRFQSDVNATVHVQGAGTGLEALALTATGAVMDTSIAGARLPLMSFTVMLDDGAAVVDAQGTFADVNPAAFVQRQRLDGSLGGSVSVHATIDDLSAGMTPENIAGNVQVMLQPSTIGGIAIDSGAVDIAYHDSSAQIRKLEIDGPDLRITVSGPLVLDTSGQSHVEFHASAPRLAEVGRLFDVPVSGSAEIQGTITGNRGALQATGMLGASRLDYEDYGALSASSDYTVRIPDLQIDRAHVEADAHATFATVAGQDINELAVKATYEDKQLAFDATARQPERTVSATGQLLLHPDHQEVHLEDLALDTRAGRWQLAEGSSPAVQYGGDGLTVENAVFASGDQRVAVDGTFGRPGSTLAVTLQNVKLESVDALMLRPPQLSGRLDASATIAGTREMLEVSGTFDVTNGGFRKFMYDSLSGTATYTGAGIRLDATLRQNATQQIEVEGYAPMALFSAQPATAGARGATTSAQRVDLTIESTPIDLGIVQGFTTALADVTGTAEVHLRVTGSAADPHLIGSLTVQNGSAQVVPTDVRYRMIGGRVDFQPDRVNVERFSLVDNHGSELAVMGTLAFHERAVGDLHLTIDADDFKVIDNDLGNVRIRADLALTGGLRSPRLEGMLGVTTGSIDLDEVQAILGTSPYPTRSAGAESDANAPGAGGPFDRLAMDLHVTVPDDLVVKADSLQAPDAPIGLGALSVTLGGNLQVTKAPGNDIRLVGGINTIRGTYDFQGRRFEILRDGTVRFVGLQELNPRLDVHTQRVIQGVEARVTITGTLRMPRIELSSTPPLDDADILSLIVFNQPINQLGEGEQISLAARAQAIAAGAVVSRLSQSVGQALSLDTFEINLTPESGRGVELTFGEQLGENLFVRVQQGVGDQSSTNVMLEYELLDWLRLRTTFVGSAASTQQALFRRAESTGIDLIVFFSY